MKDPCSSKGWLIVIASAIAGGLCAFFYTGCTVPLVEKDAIKAAIASPEIQGQIEASIQTAVRKEINAQSGTQVSGERGINVGTVVLNGSAIAFIAVAAVAIVGLIFYLQKSRKRGQLVGLLTKELDGLPEKAKECIRLKALSRGLERELHPIVKRAKRRKGVPNMPYPPPPPPAKKEKSSEGDS